MVPTLRMRRNIYKRNRCCVYARVGGVIRVMTNYAVGYHNERQMVDKSQAILLETRDLAEEQETAY